MWKLVQSRGKRYCVKSVQILSFFLVLIFVYLDQKKLRFWTLSTRFEDCRKVCSMGLVVGENYVLCLVIVLIIKEFGQAGK